MTASAPELLGMLLACGGAAVALFARDPRLRYGSAAVALIVAPALVGGDVWHTARFVELRHNPAKLAVGIAVGVVAVVGVAALFRRLPWAFPVSVVAALPLRLPVQIGGETSHLLVPLYLVVAAGLVCFAYEALTGRGTNASALPGAGDGTRAIDPPELVWLYRALAATLLLYALQTAYSTDVSNAIENAAFFLVPFAVMFVLLAEVRWTRRLLGGVLVAIAGLGLLFAAVAFWEYAARDLILNRDLLQANQLHLYFRVNSIFFDPNVFGRYMALILIALGAYLAWSRSARGAALAALVSIPLLAALALSYSVTSFAALVAGLLVLVGLRWGLRRAATAAAAVLVAGAIFVAASSPHLGTADQATSGRVDLVHGGIDLAKDRPVGGWGSGSFGAAFSRHIERARTTTSHSEPITVAAEQGGIGLVVYVGLVVLALLVLLRGAGASAAPAAVAACFVAMLVHSLGYAGFAIDPATWALLAVGIALRRHRPAPTPVPATDAARDRGPSPQRERRPAAV
jgi:putative inorganic carbon (HCO3(-)) transporter